MRVRDLICWAILGIRVVAIEAQQVPHNQDKAPGPALTPQQAVERMVVPRDFQVQLFASEPDLVNPVAMTFDERGRVWVTESLEYPRSEPGKGRDRIKILEDTDRDGKADKFTVFAEGLNIPSGIALGHGGAYVANAPDLLFLRDTDGDGRADERRVLLSGFGRTDTHELPNCLTWGPDGWLYGLNGVFNYSNIIHRGKKYSFTVALWRYHPRRDQFELFCEGTSNPWGLDYNHDGSFFVSACVIDHLWHLTETGYYHRQAGAYPPFTWKIESIVAHRHQKAAYCGLCFYDADVYPERYRGRLFMGNIHGGCINSDRLEPRGASYFANPEPDFLTANDSWFMPVAQKVGPDGCIWVLDWYDRYHCYQDARRDPRGIDRLKGRLYRVTYKNTPIGPATDLGRLSNEQLFSYLGNANHYYRRTARQLLIERATKEDLGILEKWVFDGQTAALARHEALFARVSAGDMGSDFLLRLLHAEDAETRAWGVRAVGETGTNRPIEPALRTQVLAMAADTSPLVRLQVAIAARKIPGDALPLLLQVLAHAHKDESELTMKIVWRNLEALLDRDLDRLVAFLTTLEVQKHPAVAAVFERVVERTLATGKEGAAIATLMAAMLQAKGENRAWAARALRAILRAALTGELPRPALVNLGKQFGDSWKKLALPITKEEIHPKETEDPRRFVALGFAALLGNTQALVEIEKQWSNQALDAESRSLLMRVLIRADREQGAAKVVGLLDGATTHDERLEIISTLATNDSPATAASLLARYAKFHPTLRAPVLDLLSSRPHWGRALVEAVSAKNVPLTDVNANQLRKLLEFKDKQLTARVESLWGIVRTERNPRREQVISRMKEVLRKQPGSADRGVAIFQKVCAQCHKLHGQGYAVGPDLTTNGRGSLDQLLSNLLDPNLVIGRDYQARVLATTDGRVITGLIVEESPTRVILKLPNDKLETIPRADVEAMKVSNVSMMPEDLEKQLKDQEFRDLIAYLLREIPAAPTKPAANDRSKSTGR